MVKKKRKKTRSLTRKRQNNDNGPENILSTKKTIKKQESFRLWEYQSMLLIKVSIICRFDQLDLIEDTVVVMYKAKEI